MKSLTIYSTLVLVGLFCNNLTAQNGDDAFRYSRHDMLGSARFNAMGGAFTALGGDHSAIHVNPAAVGVFRNSSMSFSPYLSFVNTESTHQGSLNNDQNAIFKFSNIGFVFAKERNSSKWRNSGFGISFNKLADYNQKIAVGGTNNTSSLLDQYRDDLTATGVDFSDPFSSLLAWDSYLVDLDTNTGEFFSQIQNYGQNQTSYIEQKGDLRETVFAYGGNYDDKLYLGASIGLLSARYEVVDYFSERLASGDTTTPLNEYSFENRIDAEGSGVRASIGFIYRPINSIRIGGSAQSSSTLFMEEAYSTNVNAAYDSITFNYDSPQGFFEYEVKSPAKYNAGIAFIAKKYGLISVDYDYTDYRNMNLRSQPRSAYDFVVENTGIRNSYSDVHNLRVGAELRVLKPLSLRLGYGVSDNAIQLNFGDNKIERYSAGFGIKSNGFYFDIAGILSTGKSQKHLYDPAYIEASELTTSKFTVSTTFGFKF